MKTGWLLLPFAALAAGPATAIPRFAARNGMECIQCHVNPTGGGVRNAYGANVFEKTWLPLAGSVESWMVETPKPAEGEEPEGAPAEGEQEQSAEVSFSGTLFEWLTLGADARVAYIYIRPDKGVTPELPREITSSFFLMQADLYHAARLNDYLTLVVDVGIYSGFEAWGLIHALQGPELNLWIKAGRFLPPFGVREVEHQLYTREGVGLGARDRDTGLEVTATWGRFGLSAALLNGTLGDSAFDVSGTERRTFEKAVAARAYGGFVAGPLRAQLGGSFYLNDNMNQANPIFSGVLPEELNQPAGMGVDELRAGGFVMANLGRFTYLADLVVVRDTFTSEMVPPFAGYALYQEASFIPLQGLELVFTHEWMDQDLDVADTATQRFGAVAELFPWAYTEVRAMFRKTISDTSPTGGAIDFVLFLHVFM